MAHAGLLQVAEFSRCAGNSELLSICRDRFASVLVPNQIAPNGNFPLELARTKPYGYCLFNLDAMGTLCAILASVSDTVWILEILDGRGIRKAVEYMFPFIADNRRWLLPAVAPAGRDSGAIPSQLPKRSSEISPSGSRTMGAEG